MPSLDLVALRQHLKAIGWTMSRLTDIVDVTAENRQTIWHLIRPDAMANRIEVARVRAHFPSAKVISINTRN